jgi:nucleotide-binding universal stress UspA family protein
MPHSSYVDDPPTVSGSRPKQILVAFDGSESSFRALDAAADLAGYGTGLAVVHVRRPGAETRATVEAARERLLRRHLVARYLEPYGAPADQIVEAARVVDADLIVLGRRNAWSRMLGSVSAAVLRRATCDVLVAG